MQLDEGSDKKEPQGEDRISHSSNDQGHEPQQMAEAEAGKELKLGSKQDGLGEVEELGIWVHKKR